MKFKDPLPWFKVWVNFILPIAKKERKKVLLLLLLKFLISFVYCILTSLKDTALITAPYSGAEAVPVIKGYIIFPISIGVFMLYTKLSNHFKQSTLFYGIILTFFTFVLLYGFVLYPNVHKISPHGIANWLNVYTQGKYLHWIAVLRHWIHVLFFIVAELWGQVVIVILYWSFVNNIYKIHEAKRLYAILIAAGDIAMIISAPLILHYTKIYKNCDFLLTVQALISYVAILCVLVMVTYWSVDRMVALEASQEKHLDPRAKKLRLSFLESLRHVFSSRHLVAIAVMMIACGLSINILEGTWKSYLKEAFPKSSDYQEFTSKLNFWTGIIAFCLSFFVSGGIIRRFGWNITAKIPPIIIGLTGFLFFLISYCKNHMPCLFNAFGTNLVFYIVILGGIQSLLAKVVKYTFYDKTLQIAYIPLDPETKIKGKAAVDLLGSRLGKAGSSWIQTALLYLCQTNSIQPLSGVLCIFLLITTIFWYQAVNFVGKQVTLFEKKE